jgi:hypothetical protein
MVVLGIVAQGGRRWRWWVLVRARVKGVLLFRGVVRTRESRARELRGSLKAMFLHGSLCKIYLGVDMESVNFCLSMQKPLS